MLRLLCPSGAMRPSVPREMSTLSVPPTAALINGLIASAKGPVSIECAGSDCDVKLTGLPIQSITANCTAGECLVPTEQELNTTSRECSPISLLVRLCSGGSTVPPCTCALRAARRCSSGACLCEGAGVEPGSAVWLQLPDESFSGTGAARRGGLPPPPALFRAPAGAYPLGAPLTHSLTRPLARPLPVPAAGSVSNLNVNPIIAAVPTMALLLFVSFLGSYAVANRSLWEVRCPAARCRWEGGAPGGSKVARWEWKW